MGTSSSHRSPSTREWERVRELYRQYNPNPLEVLSRIVSALDRPARAGLSDAATVCCLERLLNASAAAARGGLGELVSPGAPGPRAPAIGLAAGIKDDADRRISQRGVSSRYGDIALQALGSSILELAGQIGEGGGLQVAPDRLQTHLAGFYAQSRLHSLTSTFLVHDFEHAFRYFVARDIPQFVGTEALPTVAESVQLQDRIAGTCRLVTGGVDLGDSEGETRGALEQPDPEQRIRLLHGVLRDAVGRGLSALASAGG